MFMKRSGTPVDKQILVSEHSLSGQPVALQPAPGSEHGEQEVTFDLGLVTRGVGQLDGDSVMSH